MKRREGARHQPSDCQAFPRTRKEGSNPHQQWLRPVCSYDSSEASLVLTVHVNFVMIFPFPVSVNPDSKIIQGFRVNFNLLLIYYDCGLLSFEYVLLPSVTRGKGRGFRPVSGPDSFDDSGDFSLSRYKTSKSSPVSEVLFSDCRHSMFWRDVCYGCLC